MDIKQKTLGLLIDELQTTNLKLWFSQEIPLDATDELVAEMFRKCQTLNARRNALIRAIDEIVGQNEYSPTRKTYK